MIDPLDIKLAIANEQVWALVDAMRRADPAYCETHGVRQIDDEEWDEVLADSEDYLEEIGFEHAKAVEHG
jgi:hypothetical protein